jgi:hypothetical protein
MESRILKDNKYLLYLLMFIIIYVSDDTYLFRAAGTFEIFTTIKYVIYYLLTFFMFFRYSKLLKKSDGLLLTLIIGLLVFTSIINIDLRGGSIYQITTIILSLLLVKRIQLSIFVDLYCRFMYFFAITSLLVMLITNVYSGIVSYFPLITNTIGRDSHFLFLFVTGEGPLRNMGIFREPGVYMIYLNIALMFTLYYNNKLNKKYIFTFLICIITTASTAGIIVAGILMSSILITSNNNFTRKEKRLLLLFPILFGIFFIINQAQSDLIFDKLSEDSAAFAVSTMARVASLFVPLKMLFSSFFTFIFGSGLTNFSILFEEQSRITFGIPFTADGTATNTIMNKFATYGFLFGTIYMVGIYRFCKKTLPKQPLKKLIFFVLLLMMFSNEDVRNSFLFNMIFFYGMTRDLSLNKEKLK